MARGKYALKLVDQFNFLDLMVTASSMYSLLILNVGFFNFTDKLNILSVGELVCPAYHELCSRNLLPVSGQCPKSCSFNGDCVDGRCRCFLGFHGSDCSKRELFSYPFYIRRDNVLFQSFKLNF